MREYYDSVWSEWFGEAESLATDIGAVITIPRICKYQQHRSNVSISFLDSLLSQMNERFSIENRVVQSLMSLCPSIICKLCTKDSDDLAKQLLFWEADLPSAAYLKQELVRWKLTLLE